MSRFREVLKNRNFFFLLFGQIISQIGDRLDQMALIAFVYSRTPGSTMQIAKILSFTLIPVFLIGPVAGVYVDRWDRRKTMYACDLLRAALVLAIPLFLFYAKNIMPVYLVIFIVFSIGRFFIPAKLSIIPELVAKKDLLMANSLINTTGMIAAIMGFGISGIIIETLGAKSGFYLDSLSFLFSGALVFFIAKKSTSHTMNLREVGREIVEVISKSVIQEIKEGALYFINKKNIRFAAGVIFILWSALGATYVVLIVFVQKILHSATKDLGFLIVFLGFGLFSGSIVYGRFGQRLSHYKVIFASLVSSGIILIVFSLTVSRYPYFLIAAALSCLLGFLVAPIMIAANTIVHDVSDNKMQGKVFSSMEIVMHLGFLIFMFISSFLAEIFPEGLIIIIIGCILSILGALNLIYYRKFQLLN